METRALLLSVLLLLAPASVILAQGGSLTPPGAPAPTMKTLQQIEPRTEINATNTPGDADSVCKITQPGSYYLSGNLTGVSGKMGIEIAVAASGPSVTIDLGGFELIGVAGSLEGINATTSGARNLAIRNGTVRGWGGRGIDLNNSQSDQLADLRVQGNGGLGIYAGNNSVITGCILQSNGAEGIIANIGCTLSHCTANGNTGRGIVATIHCTVTECAAYSNLQSGITASTGCTLISCAAASNTSAGIFGSGCSMEHCTAHNNGSTGIINEHGTIHNCTSGENGGDGFAGGLSTMVIRGCTAYQNTGDGIHAPVASTVSECTSTGNGGDGIDASSFNVTIHRCVTDANTGNGIRVGSICRVTDNQCYDNGKGAAIGSGIYVSGPDNRIDNNNVIGNDFGINVDGTGNLIVRNSASGNTSSNYSFNVAGNKNAQVLSPGSAFVSTDPWANFAY